MSPSITSEVVDFILKGDTPPADVKTKALEHIMDGTAVMLAGTRTACVKKLVAFVCEKGGTPASTLLGFDVKTPPSDAALVNGTSGHADDYDDTQLSSYPDRTYGLLTHPTVPVLASALAVGEVVNCSGSAFLEAFIAGFEVECKLAEAINPEHYEGGFHSTGTLGAFGACAAASKLLSLSEEEVRYALGITASLSSGIRVNFGTMTKPLHAGMAAANGVVASMLAKNGFTADREALDGRWGFLNVLGHGSDSEKIVGKLGDPYVLRHPGASIKMYPCGSLAQPSMDTLLEIVLEENLEREDVQEIRVRAGPNILDPLRYQLPVNGLQAKFSLPFGLACVLVKRRAGLREYTTEVVRSLEMREVMAKVKTILDAQVARMGKDKMRSIIEVARRDGRVIQRVADTARGTPEKPLQKAELFEKFRECASFVLDEKKIADAFNTIGTVEDLSSITELTARLTGKSRRPVLK
jgi:2-methylcitrate dehydratase PrpD